MMLIRDTIMLNNVIAFLEMLAVTGPYWGSSISWFDILLMILMITCGLVALALVFL